MQRLEKIEKWIVYIAAMLLCLVLVSFWMMCNLYARYTTEASGEDGARVAKFEVTEVGKSGQNLTQQMKIDVYPGFAETYSVGVTNKSEVAIEYKIEAKNETGNLPLQFQMLDESRNEIAKNSAEISAGDTAEHTYMLKISWPKNTENQDENRQNPDYAGKTDVIKITLSAIQKD